MRPPTRANYNNAGGLCRWLDRSGFGLLGRLRRIELAVALFDAAGPLVPGDRDADVVGAHPLACRGDFLLRPAVCQGKDLISEARRVSLTRIRLCRRPARSTTGPDCSARRCRAGSSGRTRPPGGAPSAVARQHPLGSLELVELACQPL